MTHSARTCGLTALIVAVVAVAALAIAAGFFILVGKFAPAGEPPVVTVEATYPGATATAIEETLATPIEQQVNGVEHLLRLRSHCRDDGSYRLEATFTAGTDLNMAQVLVQNRASLALPILPVEVQRLGVTVRKGSPGVLMIVCLLSPDGRFDGRYLRTYATIQLKDELARLPGVAEVNVLAEQDFAVRIWLDREKLMACNLNLTDVQQALDQQRLETTAGEPSGTGAPDHLKLNSLGDLRRVEELETIVLRTNRQGGVIRLRDVARLEINTGEAGFTSLDGKPAAMLVVYPLPPTRPQDVSASVEAKLRELSQGFPEGLSRFAAVDFSRKATTERPACLLLDLNLPAGASSERIARILNRCEQFLLRLPEVRNVLTLSEQPFDRDRQRPCIVVCLKPPKGAAVDRQRLIREIHTGLTDAGLAAVRVRDLFMPEESPRFGYPIEFTILGPDRSRVDELAKELSERMLQSRRFTDLWAGPHRVPKLSVDIDRAKAAALGLNPAEIWASVNRFLGSAPAGGATQFARTWPVRIDADNGPARDVDTLNQLKVRNDKGEMVPLRAVSTVSRKEEPSDLERVNFSPAVSITASPAGGLSLAEARFVCERLAAQVVRKQEAADYRLVWLREMPAARAPAAP
jgi:multidrug efflux pump subunit AcrB